MPLPDKAPVAGNDGSGSDVLPTPAAADHLVVLVDGREYGIPMSSVREVSSARLPTMVPGVPDYIRGVVSFDDQPTPVVDPARFMDGPLLEFSARSCLVFIGGLEREWVAALLIDDIVGVFNAAVEHEPKGRTEQSPLLASSFVAGEGQRVAVMQLQALFDAHAVREALPATRKETRYE